MSIAVYNAVRYTEDVIRTFRDEETRRVFGGERTLWTNSYFVSTVGGSPLAVVKQYIENPKRSER